MLNYTRAMAISMATLIVILWMTHWIWSGWYLKGANFLWFPYLQISDELCLWWWINARAIVNMKWAICLAQDRTVGSQKQHERTIDIIWCNWRDKGSDRQNAAYTIQEHTRGTNCDAWYEMGSFSKLDFLFRAMRPCMCVCVWITMHTKCKHYDKCASPMPIHRQFYAFCALCEYVGWWKYGFSLTSSLTSPTLFLLFIPFFLMCCHSDYPYYTHTHTCIHA